MNAEHLLAHYERIADAPDAIATLRSFILELAVRGKLVPQDAKDESASKLLKRIVTEKARLVKAGTARKSEIDDVDPDDVPFSLPAGWIWTRLGSVGDWGSGSTPPRGNLDLYGGNITWLKSGELNDNRYLSGSEETVTEIAVKKGSFRLNRPGDVLIAMYGATIGKVAILAEEAVTNQAVCGCTPFGGVFNQFLFLFLLSQREQFHTASEGGAQPNISKVKIVWTPFPLPPFAEQHRIVAKVDEMMALCDRLEAARAERETTRDRLAASTLARLNTPDPATFQADARFALNTIPALTTRPDQIKQLRQTILNLAVRGKLVPQDPKDEPINVLLSKAIARRAALVRTKTVRLKKLDGYDSLVIDSELPASWKLERLGNLVDPENTISYGVLVPGDEVPDGISFVRAQDLALSGHPERPNKTISPEIEKAYARTRLHGGEILVCVVGSIGKLGIVPLSWAGANIARAVARILPIAEISREYLLVVLRGEPVQTYFTETTRTLAQPTLNIGLIEQTPIPLPPLAEQHRIVAKVDALMKICDQLEASLDDTATTCRHLLDALLAEALAPNQARELEAEE